MDQEGHRYGGKTVDVEVGAEGSGPLGGKRRILGKDRVGLNLCLVDFDKVLLRTGRCTLGLGLDACPLGVHARLSRAICAVLETVELRSRAKEPLWWCSCILRMERRVLMIHSCLGALDNGL